MLARSWNQLSALASEEGRELLTRTRSILSLALHLLFAVLLLFGLAKIQAHLEQAMSAVNLNQGQEVYVMQEITRQLELLFPGTSLISEWPLVLILFQFLSLVWLPSLAALVSSDMITVDINRGTLRFLLLRSGRIPYFLAKFFAHSILFLGLQLVTLSLLVLFCAFFVESFSWDRFLEPAVRFYLVYSVFTLVVVGLTSWISSWCSKPMNALILVHLIWFVILILSTQFPQFTPLYAEISRGLIVPVGDFFNATIIGQLAWAALFLGFGLIGFLRRDL